MSPFYLDIAKSSRFSSSFFSSCDAAFCTTVPAWPVLSATDVPCTMVAQCLTVPVLEHVRAPHHRLCTTTVTRAVAFARAITISRTGRALDVAISAELVIRVEDRLFRPLIIPVLTWPRARAPTIDKGDFWASVQPLS